MCNAAVRILYRDLNGSTGWPASGCSPRPPTSKRCCARTARRLFSLETGRPLRSFDLIAFSIGFELTLTNLFAILDLGGVPLRAADRGEGDPIVIAGGPAATNPAPLGAFLDGVFIGEAEGWLAPMFTRLAAMKRAGAEPAPTCWTRCAAIRRSGTRDARSPCGGRSGGASAARPRRRRTRCRACAWCRTTAPWRSCAAAPTPAGSATPRPSTVPAGARTRPRSAARSPTSCGRPATARSPSRRSPRATTRVSTTSCGA